MKNKILVSCLILFVVAGCFRPPHPPPPMPPSKEERKKEFINCFRQEMNPTDDQIKQLKEKILIDDSDVLALNEKLEKATVELETRLEKPATQDQELLERFKKVGDFREKLSENHFRRMLALRKILDDRQKSRFLACKRKMGPPALPHE